MNGRQNKMNNRIKIEFLSLSENEALARAVAASIILPLDPTLEQLDDIKTAVSEAVTNAIVHAYADTVGTVIMECELNEAQLSVSVSDTGKGIEDIGLAMQPFFTTGASSERTGMGFAVMQAFMDSVEVISEPQKGTTVTMKKSLR